MEEPEAKLLTVALQHLGQSWGATEEDLHLALLCSSHFLEHLESEGWREQKEGWDQRPVLPPPGGSEEQPHFTQEVEAHGTAAGLQDVVHHSAFHAGATCSTCNMAQGGGWARNK